MLWGCLNRCYFLPVHTKYGLCSVRLSVAGDAGVQRDSQFSWRQSQRPVSWSCLLSCTGVMPLLGILALVLVEAGPGLVQYPSTMEVFWAIISPPALLPILSVSEKVFFKEKLSCKKLQRKQKWPALLNREVHFLCSSAQHRACKAALGLQLVLQQFTPIYL